MILFNCVKKYGKRQGRGKKQSFYRRQGVAVEYIVITPVGVDF